MLPFPAELWDRIANFLTRPDLANLALASSSHVILSRWHLYRSLVLRSDLHSVQSTIALLGRDEGLGKRVGQLELVTSSPPRSSRTGSIWLDPDIFKSIPHLRSIHINRCPCHTIEGYSMFLSSLHKNCPDLRRFRATAMEWPEVTPGFQGSNVAPFPFLQKVGWTGGAGSHPLSAFSLIQTSCSTVTHLTLGMNDGLESLYGLHLPKLCSLNVGHGIPPTHANRFTAFLVSHPAIHDLTLLSPACILSGSVMKVNMLPHLRSLSAHSGNLKQLSRHCDSTQYIQSLVCDFAPSRVGTVDSHPFAEAAGHFPNLKHCALKTFNVDLAMQFMDVFGRLAPDLEWWSLASYYRDHVSILKLRHLLFRFPKLKRLDLGEWTEPKERPTPNQLHALRELVSKNRLLERIDLYMPHSDKNQVAFSFRAITSEPRNGHRVTVLLALAFDYLVGDKDDRMVELGGLDWQEELLLEA